MFKRKSDEKRRRRRKIILFVLSFILLAFFVHATGVDAKTTEFVNSIVRKINPPKPIVKSSKVLPASVQSSIETIAKQEIQREEANLTLPTTSDVRSASANTNDIQIALTFNPVSKAKLRLKKVDGLMVQLQELLDSDRSNKAIDAAVGIIQTIGSETGKVANDPKAQADREVLTLLIQQYNRLQINLQQVEDTLPMAAYLKVEAARAQYILKPAHDSLNNAPNLEITNNIGNAEVKKIVGSDFFQLKAIEILTDLGSGLTSKTDGELTGFQKELALEFEKQMLKLPPSVRQRKLADYINFSYGDPIDQVKAFDKMQDFLTDREVIIGIHNLKELALKKLSNRISEANDPSLYNQFLDTVIKNPKDLEVLIQMQLQKNNPGLEIVLAKKIVEVFGNDPEIFRTTFVEEKDKNVSLQDVALTNYLQKTLKNESSIELNKLVLKNFVANVNGNGFHTSSKLGYNSVPQNADVRILIPNPGAIELLNSLKITGAVFATQSILRERLLSATIDPEVFDGYEPFLAGILPASTFTKVRGQVDKIEAQENQRLFEKIQQITQAIFLTDTASDAEKLLPDFVQKEIQELKAELPSREIPKLSLPEGVTLPEVAKLPDSVNNAIVTAAEDKIDEQNKPEDLKLDLQNLASNLGVSVPAILPDSPLYVIKEIVRIVELVLTTDPIARAELLLNQDNEKTLEAAKLIENSHSVESVDLALSTLNSVSDDFEKLKAHTDEVVKLVQTEPAKVDGLVTQIIDNGLARQTVFSEIENNVHGDKYVAVEEVRTEVLANGIDTLLALTSNDVQGLIEKLETAVENQQGGTLSEIKAVVLLNEIARTKNEETQQILQEAETNLVQSLEEKLLEIPEEKRIQTVLEYADYTIGNPVREFEAYEILKDNFTNPEVILLVEGMKSEAIANLTDRITEITDALTQADFVDIVVGNEPQDLKVALEIEANVAPLQNSNTAEVLPVVQKVEELIASIEQNIIDTYKDNPEGLASADFFANQSPDIIDVAVAQDLREIFARSPEVATEVLQVAIEEEIKIIDTFVQHISTESLNPVPETLSALIDLRDQVSEDAQVKIDIAINVQIDLMQTYLTTEVTDPATFETYITQIAGDPVVAQVVESVGGQDFQQAIGVTSQALQKEAEVNQIQLADTIAQIQQEIFSTPSISEVERTLPASVQAEIEQIKEELPVSQIPSVTVEALTTGTVPVAPASEAPKVGL